MVAAISTDTTLRADFLILEQTLDALQDAAEFSGDSSVGLHTAIWDEIQRDLLKRRPPLTESDLADSSALQHAAHLLVLARLYGLSDIEADKIEAAKWRAAYRQEMREVNIDDEPAAASETLLVRA